MKNIKYLQWACGAVILASAVCTFVPDPYDSLEMRRADAQGDTVSVFPTLRFAFSQPVANDDIVMSLEPDGGAGFYTQLNATKDTVDFIVTGMLDGRTQYTVSTTYNISSGTTGSVLSAGTSFSFFTHAREQEPNDAKDTTYAFINPLFGEIQTNLDTDFFYMDAVPAADVYLRVFYPGIALGIGLSDSSGQDTVMAGSEAIKYLAVPPDFQAPLFVRVYSVFSTGRYELGTGAF